MPRARRTFARIVVLSPTLRSIASRTISLDFQPGYVL